MNIRGFLYLCLVIGFACVGCSSPQPNTTIDQNHKDSPPSISTANLYSILVAKKGELVSQHYYNGQTAESLCDVQSLTKGIISILIGIAIERQFIPDENATIDQYFPTEYAVLKNPNKRAITIKHLLNQTSGLAWKGYPEHAQWLASADPILFVLNKELQSTPGSTYNYNTGATHLLSVILSKATGMSTLEFAHEVLFEPLEITTVEWQKRNKGHYDGGGLGLKLLPKDLLKIGRLLETGGLTNGLQIVSKQWVQKLFDTKEKSSTQWGLKGSKHGYCWYSAKLNGQAVKYGMGYGGQFIVLIPNFELVVVATHHHDTPQGIQQQLLFLNQTLPQLVAQYKD